MADDSTQTIFRSAKQFFSGTMLSRVTGLLRDITMAFAFGTHEAVAALFVAYRFAHLFRRLLGEGAMQSAFVPQFEELRKDDPDRALRFFRDLYAGLSLLLVILILLAMVTLSGLIHLSDIFFLTILLLPSLLFICLYGLNAALLQCEKYYFISSVSPVAFNLFWIIGAITLRHQDAATAMPRMTGFIILACLAQWLFTLPRTLSILKMDRPWKGISLFSPDIYRFGKPLFLGIIGIAAAQINNALDVVFARYADPEGPAYLWYAVRIQQLPIGLFGVAIAGALLPPLSRAIKAGDLEKYKKFFSYALSRILLLMIPVTCAYLVGADTGINLVYGRGSFTQGSIIETTQCLWAYSLGIIPLSCVLILAPAFYAQGNYRTPTTASMISVGINLICNTLFVFVMGFGSTSVALATSISAWCNAILLFRQFKHSLQPQLSLSLRMLSLSLLAVFVVITVDHFLLNGNNALKIAQGIIPVFPHHLPEQATRMIIEGVAFISVIFIAYWQPRRYQ